MKILDKLKPKEAQPNRSERRKSSRIFPRIGNIIKRKVQLEDRIKRRKRDIVKMQNRADKSITMRLVRDIERQRIAREHGVNWKRVILTTKVDPGKTEYVIKKS